MHTIRLELSDEQMAKIIKTLEDRGESYRSKRGAVLLFLDKFSTGSIASPSIFLKERGMKEWKTNE